ncbi:hypothetical protein F5Y10DRAFT_292209 [Nemania abortiva]|nr:hypothetical protein F5Y10DRAFT_292209 [Nemania abortiva]
MWRPVYLRLWVLTAFSLVFAVLVAIHEALITASNSYKGLATADQRFQSAWTYGPTIVFLTIAYIWDRVTFQAQLLAPWDRMKKSATGANEGLLLDYLDMLPPTAIIRALKCHDWAPAAALSISLVLQVVITLSTNLIKSQSIQIDSLIPIELKDQFYDAASDFVLDEDLAYVTMAAISELQFPYPRGATAQITYQTPVNPPLLGTNLRLRVDGFAAALECGDAELRTLETSRKLDGVDLKFNTTFEVRHDDCTMTLSTEVATAEPRNFTSLNFVRMLTGSCSAASFSVRNRTSIIVGTLDYTIDNPNEPDTSKIRVSKIRISTSAQAICVPIYSIKTIGLVQNGTSEDVGLIPESNSRNISNLEAWDFVLAQVNIINRGLGSQSDQDWEIDLGDGSAMNFNAYTSLVRSSELRQIPNSELTNATLWLDAIPRYFQKFSAQIAHNSLLKPISTTIIGNQTRNTDRLIVVGLTCHATAALFGLCTLLSIVIIVTLPRNSSMTTNPTSIIGTAWAATEAPSLLLRLRDQGLGKSEVIQQRLGTAAYVLSELRPNVFKLLPDHRSSKIGLLHSSKPKLPRRDGKYALALHPVSRSLFLLSLSGGIVILEVLLRLSQRNDGIGPSNLSQYLQYSWTVVPSVFFTAMALVAGSIDTATRSLAPFLILEKGGSFSETVSFDLLDGSLLRLFFKGLKAKYWPAAFTIAALEIAAVFNIFAGLLYVNVNVPTKLNTTLRANTTFGLEGIQVSYGSPIGNPVQNSGGKDICKLYSGDQIRTNLTMDYIAAGDNPYAYESETYRVPNPLRMDIDGEDCLVNHSIEYVASTIMIPTLQEGMNEGEVTFGVSSGERYGELNYGNGWVGGCGTMLYAWGRVAVGPNRKSTVDAFALGCSETFEVVDSEVHFNGTSLMIDSTRPPIPNEDSARLADFQLNYTHDNSYWQIVGPPGTDPALVFDNFFGLLTSSPWAIPAPYLANATAVEKVVAAIHAQHGLVRANYIDAYFRVLVNKSSPDAAPIGVHVSPNTFVYRANAALLPGRPRVVQNLWATRGLQALIALTLIFSLMAWSLMPRTNVIAGSPTSIARKLALAAGGNLFEVLPGRPGHLGTEELRHKKDCKYIIGWRSPDGSRGSRERFGIWALTAEEIEKMKARRVKKDGWSLWIRT